MSDFIRQHYRHFNAAALIDAAEGYSRHIDQGGKMFMTLAGAMSTAELGLSLAEMIRRGKVHAICCTGANLEEDLFNLVAHDHYVRVPHYRELTPQQEEDLLDRHLNRVTDTCIPEEEAIRRIEHVIVEEWIAADRAGEHFFPDEYMYKVLRSGKLDGSFQIDRKDSWLYAACELDLPIFVPGWEDSTLGNIFAAHVINGDIANVHTVRSGIEYMIRLAHWYRRISSEASIGFFQIGGGIAGDFPICVVPMLRAGPADAGHPRGGATSVRSAIRRRATARTRVPCRTRRSRGANCRRKRRSTSSSPMRASSRRWCSRACSATRRGRRL